MIAFASLLVAAAVAAPSLTQLPPVTDRPADVLVLPDLPAPGLPDVPVPELPDVPLPELPDVPAREVPELPGDPPVAPPAVPDGPAPGAPAAPVTEPSPPGSRAAPAPAGMERRTATGRPGVSRQPSPRRSGAARRVVTPQLAAAVERRAPPGPAQQAAEPSGQPPGFAGDVLELIEALPAAVLWALGGIAALALGLAGNAFWQSRQRAALEAQRAELLDDIGLLSRALLPSVPDALDGLIVSAAYRPADGPAAGGDFYDVFPLGEQRVGILLGDVSGHGRASVAQAALARYTLRTLMAAGHGPGDALARADRLLVRDLPPHFVTVIAAVYDGGTAELTYAKAGHAPPIVLGTGHDPDAEVPASPIGLGLGDAWPEFRLRLSDGVSVCLYTDGLEDARIEGKRVGRETVTGLLAAQEVPDATRLIRDLGEIADHLGDDTAAVVVRAG